MEVILLKSYGTHHIFAMLLYEKGREGETISNFVKYYKNFILFERDIKTIYFEKLLDVADGYYGRIVAEPLFFHHVFLEFFNCYWMLWYCSSGVRYRLRSNSSIIASRFVEWYSVK